MARRAEILTKLRALLAEQDFPSDIHLKRGRLRDKGVEYFASIRVNDEMMRVAKLFFDEVTCTPTLAEDLRAELPEPEAPRPPEEPKRKAALPDVIDHVRTELKDDFVGVTFTIAEGTWPLPAVARLTVLDACSMRHLVYCVIADSKSHLKVLREGLSPTEQNHTAIVVWEPNAPAAQVGGQIISAIKRWRRYNWPKPK